MKAKTIALQDDVQLYETIKIKKVPEIYTYYQFTWSICFEHACNTLFNIDPQYIYIYL